MKRSWLLLSALFGLTACGQKPDLGPLAGDWTPVSVRDCSDRGEYLRFSDGQVTLVSQGMSLPMLKLIRIGQNADGTVDIVSRTLEIPGQATGTGPENGMRFTYPSANRLSISHFSSDAEHYALLTDEFLLTKFDLVRCPASA